jgi:hypothetical protein
MKTLAELQITDKAKLIMSYGEYRGSERIDLRQYFFMDGEYRPSRKGINFNSEWVDDFIKMVGKLKDI